MSWQHIVLLTLYGVNVILVWANIDKPREPYTPGLAVWLTLWTAGLVWLVVAG